MMLIEQTVVADVALPVEQLRDFLRLGNGFASGGVDEDALAGCLRAALGAVEARTAKAVLARRFKWTTPAWRETSGQVLPIAPVGAVVSVEVVDMDGGREVIAAERYRLQPDAQRPRLRPKGWALPTIPVGGFAEVVFDAGFGAWTAVPPDLGRAVLMLAAHYHDTRGALGEGPGALPREVRGLLEPYRQVRLFGGF